MQNTQQNEFESLTNSILTGDGSETLQKIREPRSKSRQKNLNIYIDGYIERLTKAVAADYPATGNYLSKEFERYNIQYVKSNPSKFYNLDFYPIKFANFLKDQNVDAFAKEISDLESNIIQSFIAEESEPLKPQYLTNLSEDDLYKIKFQKRKSGRLVKYNYDVELYLSEFRKNISDNKKEKNNILTKPDKKETYLYICRNNNEVKRNILAKEEYYILEQIFSGSTFSEAIEITKEKFSLTDEFLNLILISWFQKWLENEFFSNRKRL